MHPTEPNCFIPFDVDTEGYALPERFTFPFNYQPHPLSRLAVEALQKHLVTQNDWQHNFGLNPNDDPEEALGKMFGVLVVQRADGTLGYLAAFSGKLAGQNHHPGFVPPVFDTLEEDGFYRRGEEEINVINRRIWALENDAHFQSLQKQFSAAVDQAETALKALKKAQKEAKSARDARRQAAASELSAAEWEALNAILNQESADWHYQYKDLSRRWKRQLAAIEQELTRINADIDALKRERRQRSAALQQRLFDNYTFLNQRGETKSLVDIFPISDDILPPSGAGECAAPKLLQYAFRHQLKPVVMAEFWWGQSPSSEIRKHGHFYPACKGKCEPILAHMLAGIPMDDNPMLRNPALGRDFDIVYEDDYLLVVNKPADFLSVPGKKIDDSIQTRVQQLYPDATGPLIVHRLDMSTSGLLLIAKNKDVHHHLQSQFIKRRVKKRYTAILDGLVVADEGTIDLPIRVDLDDRPRQLVCFEHGKPAQTRWQVVERRDGKTRVHFFPITGRTHQLRVHAAHPMGLNTPILGDDLYGKRANRLHLHAAVLEFTHPATHEWMTVEAPDPF